MSLSTNIADPFRKRAGHTLTWNNATVVAKSNQTTVLNGVSGTVHPHALSCIMGPSGSGKTTLLNLLGGRISTDNSVIVKNNKLKLDGFDIDPTDITIKRKVAFVAQTDTLLATSTPREALRFSATLRLSRETRSEEIEDLVDRILTELRLSSVADNVIGGANCRGLSGGELRRVSLGIELVVRPSIVLADEVTSGLDSHNAKIVMEVCKHVAAAGASVIMTIHQPSSSIFELMDHLILLSRGHCVYEGPATSVSRYFSDRGFAIRSNFNPADWAMEVIETTTVKELGEAGFMRDFPGYDEPVPDSNSSLHRRRRHENARQSRLSRLSASLMSIVSRRDKRLSIYDKLDEKERVSWWKEIKLQLVRDLRNLKRDKRAMMLRFLIVVLGSALIAFAFNGVGSSVTSSRVGALFFLQMVNIIALQIVLLDFIEQRPLFVKEFSTDHFRMWTFGLTKVAFESLITVAQVCVLMLFNYWALELQGRFWYWLIAMAVFACVSTSIGVVLASATADPRNAKELIPLTVLPQLLFCGFFVSIDSFPAWLQWLQWLMPLTYSFRLVLHEEFHECLDESVAAQYRLNCAQAFGNSGGASSQIYDNSSVLLLPETGKYVGVTDIAEYVAYTNTGQNPNAGFWDVCYIDESIVFEFNDATSDSCDVTVGTVVQGRVNPRFLRDELKDAQWIQHRLGLRLQYNYASDLQSMAVTEQFVAFPEGFILETENLANVTKVNDHICTTLASSCPAVNERNGFSTKQQCLARMQELPFATENVDGLLTSDANSTSCRFIHASLAADRPDVHCAHISFFPEEDPARKFKCSNSSNYRKENFFSEADEQLFQRASVRLGWGADQVFVKGIRDEDKVPCSQSPFNSRTIGQDLLSLQETRVCAEYLVAQNATGEHELAYWMALIGFFVFFRSLALFLLRRQVYKVDFFANISNMFGERTDVEFNSVPVQAPALSEMGADNLNGRSQLEQVSVHI